MKSFLRRLKYYFYGLIALTLIIIFWPHGPNFNDMARVRNDNLEGRMDQLLIGVSWPIEQRGQSLINGMKLAISHIKEEGLLPNTSIELDVRDDLGEIKEAQDITTDFADNEDMSVAVGYGHDPQAAAAGVISQTAQLLQMVVGASSTQLTRQDQLFVMRTLPTAKDFANKLAASFETKPKTFAVIVEKSGYWEEFAEEFTIKLMHQGADRVYKRTYPGEIPPDYVRESLEIRKDNVDFILFAGTADQAARFIKQARQVGIKQPILCSSTDIKTLKDDVGDLKKDVILPGFYAPHLDSDINQNFVQNYRQKFNTAPDGWAAQGYDTVYLLAKAAAYSQSIKPSDMGWTLRYMPPYEGVSGAYHFTPHGDVKDKPVYVLHLDQE